MDRAAAAKRVTKLREEILRLNTAYFIENKSVVSDAVMDALKHELKELEKRYPGMRDRLLDEKGVRRFVNIYVGDEDIRFLDGLKTEVKGGDQLAIIPAIAGG